MRSSIVASLQDYLGDRLKEDLAVWLCDEVSEWQRRLRSREDEGIGDFPIPPEDSLDGDTLSEGRSEERLSVGVTVFMIRHNENLTPEKAVSQNFACLDAKVSAKLILV